MNRKNFADTTPWEEIVGYSRAVRINNIVEISGTTASENGKTIAPGDAASQTRAILEKIARVLEKCGSGMNDVVRTRIYTTDISRWSEIGAVHGEFFSQIRPATTMVEVKALISPDMLVEIEATAIIS